jgi:hypothetical protein
MASSGTKSFNLKKITIPSFPYGLDWSNSPESIPDGALVEAENCAYNYKNNALTAPDDGLDTQYTGAGNIIKGYYDDIHDVTLFVIGTTLYKTTDFASPTSVGTLNGSNRPVFYSYNGKIKIDSGGIPQEFNGTTLSNTTNAISADAGGTKDGRRYLYDFDDSLVRFSYYGDDTDWTENGSDALAAWPVYVGKSDGNIVAVSMASKDLVIFKDTGLVYRLTGWISNSTTNPPEIVEVIRTGKCFNNECVVSVGTKCYFLGPEGFVSIITTQEYGDMKPIEEGLNINAALVQNIDANAKMWHLPSRKQIWIMTQNDKKLYIYHYLPRYSDGRGVFTTRTLQHQISDVWEKGSDVYVAYGTKIAKLNENIDTDDGVQITSSIKGKNVITEQNTIVVKRRRMTARGLIAGSGGLKIGDETLPFTIEPGSPLIFGNTTKIYGNTNKIAADSFVRLNEPGGGASESVQVAINTNSGKIEIRQINYDYDEM